MPGVALAAHRPVPGQRDALGLRGAHDVRVDAVQAREQLAHDHHEQRDADEDHHVGPHRRLRALDQARGDVEHADGDAEPEQDRAHRHQGDEEHADQPASNHHRGPVMPGRAGVLPGLLAAAVRAADRGADLGAEGGAAAAAVQGAVVRAARVAQPVLVGEVVGGHRRGGGRRRRGAATGRRRGAPWRWVSVVCRCRTCMEVLSLKDPQTGQRFLFHPFGHTLPNLERAPGPWTGDPAGAPLRTLQTAHGPLSQAPHPPRRRPHRRPPAGRGARLHELHRLQRRREPQRAAEGQGRARAGPTS